ncbi:hypothetical protein TNCV_286671 [Trichonephila clavipes]|nr:hypothetical protein TNCV_286671 [Trichonephila clavipes]
MLLSWVGRKELSFWPQRNPKRINRSNSDKAPSQMHNARVQQHLTTVSSNSNSTIVLFQKLGSSVNTMSFYSNIHDLLSSYHGWRKSLWFPVKDKRSNGHLVDIPLSCKRRRMVRADTE